MHKANWFSSLLVSLFMLVSPSFLRADYNTKEIKLNSQETPAELKDVGISEHLGTQIDPNIELTNELGQRVLLRDYFHKSKPVIISLVYFGCTSLCNLHLDGLTDGLKQISEFPGTDFEILSISFDTKDTASLAAKKKLTYIEALKKQGAEKGWHFLTGNPTNIARIAENIGFKYKWNETEKQWAHASAAVIVTPDGKISRYLHGVFFEPRTLSLAVTEASKLKISNIINTFVLYCFKYDPQKSRYIIAAANVMKIGGALVMGILFLVLYRFWIRQRQTLLKQGEV